MNPLIVKGAIGVAGAFGAYEVYDHFFGKPKLQSLRRLDPFMKPVQVVVPVTGKSAVIGQASSPIPPNNGSKATFVPPPASSATASPTPTTTKLGVEPTIFVGGQGANLSVDSVADVQRAINVLMNLSPPLAADNQFGPKTSAAISAWESANGMSVDGAISPGLKTALASALAVKAATQSHIGQSLPVQQAALALAASQSPLGASLSQAGIAPLAMVIQVPPGADSLRDMSDVTPADVASGEYGSHRGNYWRPAMGADQANPATQTLAPASQGDVSKDAILKLQRLLNVLGASPALEETGTMTPETIAATKAFQIAYGLVSDGVPAAKTVTAITLAADPAAQAAVLPSVPKAANTVAVVTPAAPTPVAADHLATAAKTLADASANPAPTDAQTHASTASAQSAVAATSPATPPAVAEPLAKASNALATAAAVAPVDPGAATAAIQNAAAHVANAAAACTGPACPSLAAAADHLSAAATAPSVQAQGDSLNAAAAHLSNAAAGVAAPVAAQSAAVNGDFGWDGWNGFWQKHFMRFRRRQQEVAQGGGTATAPVPGAPPPPPAPMPTDPSAPAPSYYDGLVAQSYMPQPPMPQGPYGQYGQGGYGQGGYGQGYGRGGGFRRGFGGHPWFRGEFGQQKHLDFHLGPMNPAPPPPPPPQKHLDFHLGPMNPAPWNPPPVPPNPPPVGHPDSSAYWEARREAGYTDQPAGYGYAGGGFDRHWYHRHGRGTPSTAQYMTNAGQLEGGGDMLNPYSQQPGQNPYQDPNAAAPSITAMDGQSMAGPGAQDDQSRFLADSGGNGMSDGG